jgi:predicted Zn-dependent protease
MMTGKLVHEEKIDMQTRTALAVITLLLAQFSLIGCATPKHMSKSADPSSLTAAQREIQGAQNWVPKYVDDAAAEKKVLSLYRMLLPGAVDVCRELAEDECTWDIRYTTDDTLNAFATGESVVVIKKGVIRHAENDDEIAMVIAHEMSHHAANHIEETRQNMVTGAVVGAVIAGAIAGAAYGNSGYSSYYQQAQINNTVMTGAVVGAKAGHLSYSKEQENEADYLAGYMLYKGGFDLTKARNMWIKMARLGSTEHAERHSANTHPDPAERLARWDNTIREIATNEGALPKRPK